MQLNDLKKPMEHMSDEELRALLMEVRRRRETYKPKAEKVARSAALKKTAIDKLSKEQILARLKEMGVM